ncbi:MAG: hypothetical protein ACE5GE_10810 [Phycisphaerae bacterium]
MADEMTGLDRVVSSLREPLRAYAGLLREIHGAGALALTCFGAATTDRFDPQQHVVRNVLLLDKVDLGALRRLAEYGSKLGKQQIAAPLIMTEPYIKASLDTFPLELIEIQQTGVTLFGEDHFKALEFEEGHIRLQCERDLKALLIGLRQGLLAAAGREKLIANLETGVAEPLFRTLRGMLWLKGQKTPKPATETLSEIEKLADRKLSGIRTAMDARATHGWAAFESLYQDVEALGRLVDGW